MFDFRFMTQVSDNFTLRSPYEKPFSNVPQWLTCWPSSPFWMTHTMTLTQPDRLLAGLAFLLALISMNAPSLAQSGTSSDTNGTGGRVEDSASTTENQLRELTPEQKARLRAQYEKRSFLRHFTKMDRDDDGALTREEMLTYFTIIHAVFDADFDDVVSVVEAPALLLRIKLMGKAFPEGGLTLTELQTRLDETFTFLDKNQNGKLGWPELL